MRLTGVEYTDEAHLLTYEEENESASVEVRHGEALCEELDANSMMDEIMMEVHAQMWVEEHGDSMGPIHDS